MTEREREARHQRDASGFGDRYRSHFLLANFHLHLGPPSSSPFSRSPCLSHLYSVLSVESFSCAKERHVGRHTTSVNSVDPSNSKQQQYHHQSPGGFPFSYFPAFARHNAAQSHQAKQTRQRSKRSKVATHPDTLVCPPGRLTAIRATASHS